ncbi:MAG: hypothetical protein BWY15_01832 [Firmicutes bacterium ADurb.Bin193]|nr:MAG: hypothetical protein BWY15_01832 [Firmicutes bacterium ADurb.Bin193]
MNKLRLTFEKGEAVRYIGHLDVLRTFVRAMRRAEIPVKYSEGFNPHAVMTFALPLGVGVTSECELVDIAVTDEPHLSDVITRLNANLAPGGIKVVAAEYTDRPFREIIRAEYVIDIVNNGRLNIDDISAALAQKEILIEKKSKKKVSEINIMENIFESEILGYTDFSVRLRVVISAGNTFNIKPQLVCDALSTAAESLNPRAVFPCRKRFIFA